MRFLVLLLSAASLAGAAPKTHRGFRAAAEAAYARKDYAAAHDAYAAAVKLRPDSPRYLHNLAATAALTGQKAEALATLRQLAALGVVTPVATDRDFASLQSSPEFTDIVRRLAANLAPTGAVETLAELGGQTGLLEGLAWRERTDDLFWGDVHRRCIWRRDRTGTLTRFTAEDEELLGVFGLAIDEQRHALWAAMSALPEMSGFTPAQQGQAALAEFDLTTGDLRRVLPVPGDGRDHVLGDLVVAPDGTIYLTDSAAPIVWQFAPADEGLIKFIESPEFVSLQGIALGGHTLLVTDYSNGLFTIDRESLAIRALAPPQNTTLLGLDGLVPVPGGVVAVQNGLVPPRLLRLTFSADTTAITRVDVLAAGLPGLEDLALAATVGNRVAVVAGSGWAGFAPAKSPHPAVHTVKLLGVALH
jgi:hypothetical protein